VSAPTLLREWLPPRLVTTLGRWNRHSLRFVECEPDWDAARARSGGYDAAAILERVAAATREVVAGRAAFERDGTLFAQHELRHPVLAAVLHSAARRRGCLSVLDVGGALGSVYWQLRPYLRRLDRVDWRVIEQPAFVERGRAEFSDGRLSFFGSIEEASAGCDEPLLLLSSTLQYLPDPGDMLARVARSPAASLLIDRTPVMEVDRHALCIQRVPASIYRASYPCWLLSRPALMAELDRDWRVMSGFACEEGVRVTDRGRRFEFRGWHLERGA
jgi:putative methyltransferase (TIGR04325 family)